MKRLHTIATLAAAGALLAVPAVGQAHHKSGHTNGGNGGGTSKSCAKKSTVNKGFVVRGTLVSVTLDNPATQANEGVVTITVTGQNRHARRAGLTDVDTNTAGTQYRLRGANDADGYRLTLEDYQGTDTPSAGDAVRIVGKVAVKKKKCAAPGTSLEARYGAVNVRQVTIADRDPDV